MQTDKDGSGRAYVRIQGKQIISFDPGFVNMLDARPWERTTYTYIEDSPTGITLEEHRAHGCLCFVFRSTYPSQATEGTMRFLRSLAMLTMKTSMEEMMASMATIANKVGLDRVGLRMEGDEKPKRWVRSGCGCRQADWDWSWVDQVYCINLRERPDRFLESEAEFHRVGLCQHVLYYRPDRPTDAEWQAYQCGLIASGRQDPVMTVTKGAFGCWQSHKAIAEHALKNGHETILVFEDDIHFLPSLSRDVAGHDIPRIIQKLPDEADFLHLGYFPYRGYPVMGAPIGRLWRVKALCTVAYVATQKGIINLCRANYTLPLDFWMIKETNQFAIFPKVAWQRKSSTDVEELWLGCPTTAIKQFGNVFYRNNHTFVDTLMLIILPILALTLVLLLLFLVAAALRAKLDPQKPDPLRLDLQLDPQIPPHQIY